MEQTNFLFKSQVSVIDTGEIFSMKIEFSAGKCYLSHEGNIYENLQKSEVPLSIPGVPSLSEKG